jgi:poly-gamma-glutamate synthesis protein (capsule biosynthesis protein)
MILSQNIVELKKTKLPGTAKDIFKLNYKDWIIFNAAVWFYKITGLWKFPVQASGDLETMTIFDKIYWLYKTINPISRAYRNAGIEEYFQTQKNTLCILPEEFFVQNDLTLSAVGDLMPHAYLLNSKDILYNEVEETIFGKDIRMANLECCISAASGGELTFGKRAGPTLFYDTAVFNIIKGSRDRQYDFMATACNHSMDLGVEGVQTTSAMLKEAGISSHGINTVYEDSLKAAIIEKKGIKIGFVCFTFGLNAIKPPNEKPYLINRLNLNDDVTKIDFLQIAKQIRFCRDNEVDFIVAQLHWGYENEFYPRPEQIKVAHHLAEMGIDCIIGHHPHVVQPMEYYRAARDSNRIVPIFYSLGNLINPFSATYLTLSYVAAIDLVKGMYKGHIKTYIRDASVTEIVQCADIETETVCLRHKNNTR